MSSEGSTAGISGSNAPPKAALGEWIGMSVVVSIAVTLMLVGGLATVFDGLPSDGSLTSAAWLIGGAGGLAVLTILVAIGFVRFRPVEPPAQPRTP